ncbi:monovalent cation/H(+) antiporter subunit G [Pseudokineococcus sp. 1T1Z-3]|uniref:monovalent cation/H(+) antiporter subunit G n=1 Tax=Pseudokineococcus sp. 1T1Z-3 TaxID=3132745 RepID=UPI00309F1AA7
MDPTSVLPLLGQGLAVLGGLIFLSAALGVLRLPDLYTRTSAVATAAGLGITFVVVGCLLVAPTVDDTVKVVLAVLLQLATSVVGSMVIARSAHLTGTAATSRTRFDEMDEPAEGPWR